MSGTSKMTRTIIRFGLGIVVLVVIISFIARHIDTFGNVTVVLLGFGAVVLVHEFGHFIVAKLGGIKVEVFSIFMPPMLLGLRRTKTGTKVRILPRLFAKGQGESPGDAATFTIGKGGKESDTEYRVGLIPFGGFVKLLGQDDIGPVKTVDDPQSFANKPVSVRMAVIAAGVTLNVISAAIIFVAVFLVGINLPPAVVGGIVPDSPAAKAGLKAGDEIIEIAGKSKDLDFSSVMIEAALSGVNEAVPLKVRREDGSIRNFSLVAQELPGGTMREFGIIEPVSLKIAHVADSNELLKRTQLRPADLVKAVNGREIKNHREFLEILRQTLLPEVVIGAERTVAGTTETIESHIKLEIPPAEGEAESDVDLSHFYSMVPRLRVTVVATPAVNPAKQQLSSRIAKKLGFGPRKETAGSSATDTESGLKIDDIILAVGDIKNPAYTELREITQEHEGKKLKVLVLRTDANGVESEVTVVVEPSRPQGGKRVVIGIGVALDAEHAVVAKTILAKDGPQRLDIPRGATITAVNGKAVSSFYDCINELRLSTGQRAAIDYKVGHEAGPPRRVEVDVGTGSGFINAKSTPVESLPFELLQKLYRAQGPVEALAMGYRRTAMFIAQTYVTLQRLIGGLISPKSLMGPVGIITFSYRIVAEQPFIYYIYFLGLISAMIAVFNFLPLPPFDGGLIVLMLIEKIRGSALSEKTQAVVAYAGWVLVGTLLLYVTFNDIVRSFFS